jgi:hypothetical protein
MVPLCPLVLDGNGRRISELKKYGNLTAIGNPTDDGDVFLQCRINAIGDLRGS